MSAVRRFLSYVEIKTKVTSVFTFAMALAYLYAAGYKISPLKTAVFFLGMLLFDMTATSFNNYADTRKNGHELPFERRTAAAISAVLLLMSVACGLWLFAMTDWVVLLLGAVCFFFGLAYSLGPVPMSHGPYGEVASGFFYGVLIPAILAYINISPQGLLSVSFSGGVLTARVNVASAASLLIVSVVPFCLTAAVMLANNICDLRKDVEIGRYTLAYYLGNRALALFSALYFTAFISIAAAAALGVIPPLSFLTLLTLVPVYRNLRKFHKKQSKEETFIVSIQNFVLIMSVHTVLLAAGGALF